MVKLHGKYQDSPATSLEVGCGRIPTMLVLFGNAAVVGNALDQSLGRLDRVDSLVIVTHSHYHNSIHPSTNLYHVHRCTHHIEGVPWLTILWRVVSYVAQMVLAKPFWQFVCSRSAQWRAIAYPILLESTLRLRD